MKTSVWSGVKDSVIARFLERSAPGVGIMTESTEEILEGRRPVKMHMAGASPAQALAAVAQAASNASGPRRLEDNYLYATRCFQAGAVASNDYRFFQNAIGQVGTSDGFPAGITLTDLETNMDVGGQIAQGKNFCFQYLGISFNAKIDVPNISTLMDAGALRFSKQGDQYQLRHGPARMWPGGTGISGFTTATSTTGAHNGLADPRAVRKLRVPRVIKEKESFAYIYSVPRTTQANDGATAWSIAAPGALMTIWLWGGQMDNIPG